MATKTYKPTAAMKRAAARGLMLRKKKGKGGLTTAEAGKMGIGSGVARAANLKAGKPLTLEMVKRMHSFFSRHKGNEQYTGKPEDDAGFVSFLLWGGAAGRAFAKRIVEREKKK